MPRKKIQKSISEYISKIKSSPHTQIQFPSKKWILSSCKHPKTPSFSLHNKKNESQQTNTNNKKDDDEAALADIDRFLFENFKSLYFKDDEETTTTNTNTKIKRLHNTKTVSKEESDDDDDGIKSPKLQPIFLDGTTIDLRGSSQLTRGFWGDDEAGSSSTSVTLNDSSSSSHLYYHEKDHDHDSGRDQDQRSERDHKLPNSCVVVLASSESPYEEFKLSMQGMVDARLKNNENVDWDFMEELLFCHINLNEKKSHKFILSAFVDLITTMRGQRPESSSTIAAQPRSVRTVKIGKEVRKKTREVTLEFGSS